MRNITHTDISRRSLPKIDKMIEWGVVKAGDIITPFNRDEEAVLLANGNVEYDGKTNISSAMVKANLRLAVCCYVHFFCA